FEVVELGPPVYFTPPPPVKARGRLIPAGDGEGLPYRPAPGFWGRGSAKDPLVPTRDEIEKLPRLAREAFADRCARRLHPGSAGAHVAVSPVYVLPPFPQSRVSHATLPPPAAAPRAHRVHADRAAGGDRDHRHPDRAVAARGPEGPRGGRPRQVLQQPQAVG